MDNGKMTHSLTMADLEELMATTEEQRLSLYLPTHRMPPEVEQDPIRLKNLLREAEDLLQHSGLKGTEVKEYLAPLNLLPENIYFWQNQDNGLALFHSRTLSRQYRLPQKVENLVVVSRRFHLKPLINLFSGEQKYYVLALSQNEIRLLEGNRFGAREMELDNVPASLAEALKYDDPQRQLQSHTRTMAGRGQRSAVFHGHGVGIDDAKDNIHRYFLLIERGLQEILHQERAPLVLAGVDYLLPLYREVNTYANLMPGGVIGNPETLRPQELHARTWEIVEPVFLQAKEEAISQYRKLQGTGKASLELAEIILAAYRGRVETLLVASDVQVWGNYDEERNELTLHDQPAVGSDDLLDLAAIKTLLTGGTVFASEQSALPDHSSLAAVFRY